MESVVRLNDGRTAGDRARIPRLNALLADASSAIRDRDLAAALRSADAALRLAPTNLEVLELLAGLEIAAGDPERALQLLDRATDPEATSGLWAARIDALLASGRADRAIDTLARALAQFAVDPGDRLAQAAGTLMRAAGVGAPGWIGVSRKLDIWGEAGPAGSPIRIELREPAGRSLAVDCDVQPAAAGPSRFSAARVHDGRGHIEGYAGASRLAGSGAAYPPPFRFDGRLWWEGDRLKGWARLGWAPDVPLSATLRDERGQTREIDSVPGVHDRPWREFDADLTALGLTGVRAVASARLPDGSSAVFPDSPVVLELGPPPRPPRLARLAASVASSSRSRRSPRRVDVIVPVYEGLAETLECLDSLFETLEGEAEIVVVDDASPNVRLAARLDDLAAAGVITLLRNRSNLGFPAAVNRGLALHPRRDAVILNADAQVYPGWLRRLRAAAYSAPDIGTVTPLTNSGSIASYPAGGAACDRAQGALLARLAAETGHRDPVEAPTGVGFCMFVRRDCLAQTGPLDEAAFGRGYGEENDFCLRAARFGWRHVLAGDVFVRHIGGRSFGDHAPALLHRNLWLLNRRHPGYDQEVQSYLTRAPARPLRRALDEALLRRDTRRTWLVVTHDRGGGVDRVVRERAAQLASEGFQVLTLRPQGGELAVRLEAADGRPYHDLAYDSASEIPELLRLLRELDVAGVELHHFLNVAPAVLDALLTLGAPYDVFVHDYIWFCPRITLIGPGGRYCGEPAEDACEACLATGDEPPLNGASLPALRDRSRRWLNRARRVVAPSQDTAKRLTRRFHGLKVSVQAWEAPSEDRLGPAPTSRETFRVAVIGAIGRHKGFELIRDCLQDAVTRGLPLEFVVVGYTEDDDALLASGKAFVTGAYEEREAADLLSREAPDVALFASVWPETWCFALTHALDAGLPVVAFDIGAIAERLRGRESLHVLLPVDVQPPTLNDALLRLARDRRSPVAPAGTLDHPAAHRTGAVNDSAPPIDLSPEKTVMIPDNSSKDLTVTAEVLSLNKGVYLFAVRLAAPRRVGDDGDMVLPAIHVGTGPGLAKDSIEVMTGPRTDSCWLFEPRDVLIIKVRSSPTHMLLTSVRTPGMAPLEVSVERIDTPRQAHTPALAAPGREVGVALQASEPASGLATPGALPRRDIGGRRLCRVQTTVHVQHRGDLTFVDEAWAGAPGELLFVEAFSLLPLDDLAPDQIEYSTVTASGVESPWMSNGAMCGTRGIAVPLVGFAIRLRGGAEHRFDCEYRGAFASGRVVGPITNGAPCRSPVPDDHLEAIQVTIFERRLAEAAAERPDVTQAARVRPSGPRFSVFRENLQ